MGWNGSSGTSGKIEKQFSLKRRNSSFVWRRFSIGVLLALVVAIVIFVFFSQYLKSVSQDDKTQEKTHIAKIAEGNSQKDVAIKQDSEKLETVNNVVDHPPTNKWGNPWHWGPNKKLKPKHISRFDSSKLPLYERIFKNSADRTIAGLLVVEPGDDLIGSDEPSPWFLKSFLRSLETPVIPTKDDSEEAAALKKAVLETKIELKARMDAGEDIVKILTDTRRELRELGAYREELKKLVDNYRRKEAKSSDDLEDMVEAANKMLEDRGLKKIVMPEFYYKQIEMRTKIRKEKEEINAQ